MPLIHLSNWIFTKYWLSDPSVSSTVVVMWWGICSFSQAADHEAPAMTATSLGWRSPACCNAGGAVSLYQSECNVWFAAVAALTGLPVYPALTCSLHPFCLFLYRTSYWTSNLSCEVLCDHKLTRLHIHLIIAHKLISVLTPFSQQHQLLSAHYFKVGSQSISPILFYASRT